MRNTNYDANYNTSLLVGNRFNLFLFVREFNFIIYQEWPVPLPLTQSSGLPVLFVSGLKLILNHLFSWFHPISYSKKKGESLFTDCSLPPEGALTID